jgi:protein-S-isoprenylcysteine O-methyltransferase Ste14
LYAFFLMLVGYPPIIAWRIRDEEKTLANGLPGYREYMGRVKYRMLPFIW